MGQDDEKEIKHIFLETLQEGSIVVDVGAHLGEYSLIASKKIGKNGKIFVIEPFEKAINSIKKIFFLTNSKILRLFL